MGAQGLRWWGSRFWTEPLFLEFIYGAICFWRSWRRDSIPDLDLETYAPIVNTPSIKQLIRSHHPSLRASLFCSNISTTALSAVNASCFWLVILTHGYMTDLHFFFGKGICPFLPMGFVLCCLIFCKVFARQSLPLYRVQEKTIVLFLSDSHICFQIQSHGWNCASLLGTLFFFAFHWSHSPTFFATWAFFPLRPLEVAPLSTVSFRTLKFCVLIVWPICSITDVFSLWYLGCPFYRIVSRSYKADTVWRWTESCSIDLYKPSKTIYACTSLADNRAWSHRTSKSWTLSFCRRTLNKSESSCTAS